MFTVYVHCWLLSVPSVIGLYCVCAEPSYPPARQSAGVSKYYFIHCNRDLTRCVAMPSLMAARWVGVLPPGECYWLVNAGPLNYGWCVGQNCGPIFSRLWTKVHQIRFACARVSVVCNAVFQLTMSCCVPEILAVKLRSCPKSCRNFDVLGRQFSGEGAPKFLTEFYKSGSPSNVAKFVDDRPRVLGD